MIRTFGDPISHRKTYRFAAKLSLLPLRRKIGVMTLLLASGFGAGWVCSLSESAEFRFPESPPNDLYSTHPQYAMRSTPTGLTFEKRSYFNSGDPYAPQTETNILFQFTVPYVTIVGTFGLLSGWLLLSTPRQDPQSGSATHSSNENKT